MSGVLSVSLLALLVFAVGAVVVCLMLGMEQVRAERFDREMPPREDTP